MPSSRGSHRHLRLAVLNDSPPVLEALCHWFVQHGHACVWASFAEMRQPHIEIDRFVREQLPDVIIYDVGPPYVSSWDLLGLLRARLLERYSFVITTPNTAVLEAAVGCTAAFEIAHPTGDLRPLLGAVEMAGAACGRVS